MTVNVHMHGNLRRFVPDGRDRTVMKLPTGTTIETLLVSLGAERDTWLVAINGVACAKDCVLRAGDLLDCFEPVAAG
jgi:sulfur carrier protein ThiS